MFVVTHQAREPWVREGGTTFTFVTDGIERALEQAKAAAGDKDVRISGGANIIQQYIQAGLLDELQIQLAPILLGKGVRLFDQLGPDDVNFARIQVVDSPLVTHISYRVEK